MKVYILYLNSRTYKEIVGVYSTLKKAESARDDFMGKNATGTCSLQAFILEKWLDENGDSND